MARLMTTRPVGLRGAVLVLIQTIGREKMPRPTQPVTLPQAATDHMSDVAKSHLPCHIQPQLPNFVWDNPLAHNSVTDYSILHGTSGADVFVLDVGPALAAQSGGSTGSAYLFWDYIDNFQPGVDQQMALFRTLSAIRW